jgi:MFS family permease
VQGWDQTGSNGANLEFPQAYGIDSNSILDKTIVGLVNAAPYIGTALAGCWLSDPINNTFGRRGTIFLAAQFCLWPVIASSFCDTWVKLFGCRLLLGLGMGTKAATGKYSHIVFTARASTQGIMTGLTPKQCLFSLLRAPLHPYEVP